MAASPAIEKPKSPLRALRLCGEKPVFEFSLHLSLKKSSLVFDLLLLGAIEAFMMVFLDVRYLFYDTVVTGGDTASWHGMANHLLTELLPNGRLTGWDMGNFCGYPNFSFYFIPPFLLAVLPSYLLQIPLTITLKLAIASGIFLLPVTTYLGLRAMGYRFPGPVIGAGASLLLLFNELYTMFGGNILSTNTGEFCYMFAFALFAYFIGSLYRGVEREEGVLRNGILFGLIGLSHLFVFIPAVCLVVYLFLARGRFRYLLKVSLLAFGLMAFWILPMLAYRHPYTTPVYMIWHEFVSWRYAFMGIGMVLLFIGPRLALAAMGEVDKFKFAWQWTIIGFAGLGAFTLAFVGGNYLVLGAGLFDHGLNVTPLASSSLGEAIAQSLKGWVIPFSIALALVVVFAGLRARKSTPGFETFSYTAGVIFFIFCVLFASIGLQILFGRAVANQGIKGFLLGGTGLALIQGFVALSMVWLFFRRSFKARVGTIAGETSPRRYGMFLGLGFGCVVGYFGAHFLEVPDIRFLPPLAFVLLIVLFTDTLEPFLVRLPAFTKAGAALMIIYGIILVVIFGTSKADAWFRYNNRGYEYTMGSHDFQLVNLYLRKAYSRFEAEPLNAPRVGYEKCGLYEPYGGDRVFESLPFFAGRQTMEGIHYASSIASRFIAFLETAYSKDIKTPRPYILSRLNAAVLPAYFDLYNISQLILMTREAKESVDSSPDFEKTVSFGNFTVYRYKGCNGRYVDVPKRRPVLYSGEDWVEEFYQWYRRGNTLDLLMVPKAYVKYETDRAAFSPEAAGVEDLTNLRSDLLDRRGLRIETHIEHEKISFTTNKVGLPHVIKVSYFPNWKVEGADGVYPVSPHLMIVIPREKKVVLTYGRNAWEVIGLWVTGATLLFLLFCAMYPLVSRRFPRHTNALTRAHESLRRADARIGVPIERWFTRARPFLIVLALVASVLLIVGGALNRNKPVRAYVAGYRTYKTAMDLKEKAGADAARPYFEKAIQTMAPVYESARPDDHQDVILCMLFSAASYENLGDWKVAEALYRRILGEYPFSRYTGEAYVKIGRVKRHAGSGREAVEYFEKAIREDPYSVWAEYAKEDIRRVSSKQ